MKATYWSSHRPHIGHASSNPQVRTWLSWQVLIVMLVYAFLHARHSDESPPVNAARHDK
jgi:hypothetical protein